MSVKLLAVDTAHKEQLRQMLSAYLEELSQYGDADLTYRFFDSYWSDSDRWPYFIEKGDETVGFILLNTWSPSQKGTDYAIAEFYIFPEFRGVGVGKSAFARLLNSRPGMWELSVMLRNKAAKAFWTRTLATSDIVGLERIDFEDNFVFRFSYKP